MRIIAGTRNIEAAIRECFASDPDLLSQWHIAAPASLDVCVGKTLHDIETTFDRPSFRFYRAYEGDKLVGYWGTEFGQYINLIFVKPEFRRREFMREFWDAVECSLEPTFFTAVYAKNLPAVKFYSKLGTKTKEFVVDSHKAASFKFSKDRY